MWSWRQRLEWHSSKSNNAKNFREIPEAREARKVSSLESWERWPCWCLDFRLPISKLREKISIVLSHWVCGKFITALESNAVGKIYWVQILKSFEIFWKLKLLTLEIFIYPWENAANGTLKIWKYFLHWENTNQIRPTGKVNLKIYTRSTFLNYSKCV